MEIDDKQAFGGIDLIPFNIDEWKININRSAENLRVLNNFDDIIPKFDQKNGLHIEIRENGKDPKIVPLNGAITRNLIIPGSNTLNDDDYYKTFVEMKAPQLQELVRKTYALGYNKPSVVQAITIIELMQMRDMVVQFKSGTGKTHSFTMGMLTHFDPRDKDLQYIFLTCTHEVAIQIYTHIKSLMPNDVKVALCIGNKPDNNSTSEGGFKVSTSSLNTKKPIAQERQEIQSAQILVCTMGKLYDCLCGSRRQWITKIDRLKGICIDEFDTIVGSDSKSKNSQNMGSMSEQLEEMMKIIPAYAQRAFFSATVNEEAIPIAHGYFRKYNDHYGEPFIALLNPEDSTLEGIKQYYVEVNDFKTKQDVLADLLSQCRITACIIFVNKTVTANEIKMFLDKQPIKHNCAVFTAELSGQARRTIFEDFKKGKYRIIVGTDVVARGVDVQGINLVINFDMPRTIETYIHRVGRSARYGRRGVAINLVTSNEIQKITEINACSEGNPIMTLPRQLENIC